MARPYYTARHVSTASALPEKLTVGRVYFVDDEGYIVIDHGEGPRIYGYRMGPQGIPGAPLPELQNQIDNLVTASLSNTFRAMDWNDRRKADISHEANSRSIDVHELFTQIEYLTHAVFDLAFSLHTMNTQMRGTEAAVLKLITESEMSVEPITPATRQEKEEAFAYELMTDMLDIDGIGDTFSFGGMTWDVEQQEDGAYILTMKE